MFKHDDFIVENSHVLGFFNNRYCKEIILLAKNAFYDFTDKNFSLEDPVEMNSWYKFYAPDFFSVLQNVSLKLLKDLAQSVHQDLPS